MNIQFFSNGFTIHDGKFRKYENAKEFLTDLQDGFFPSELQTLYPNGCYFNVYKIYYINNLILQYIILLKYLINIYI